MVLLPLTSHAWEPTVKDRNAAIQAAELSSYFVKLTAWLDQQVPSDPPQITKAQMKALLANPAFMSALAERHFMAKVWGPGAWDARQLVHNEQGDNYSFSKGVRNLDLFAKAGPSNQEFLTWIMSSPRLMDEMILSLTPSSMYGRRDDSHALTVDMLQKWKQIYDADPASRRGLYLRLACACVLRPPGSANQGSGKAAVQSSVFDRYMHYRKAHAAGELLPSFDTLTVWEMTHVVSSCVSNDDLEWGREALNTWNPNFRKNEKVVDMVSQVWRRGANGVPYNDMSLVMGAGGKCGPRSGFGVFINQAFGIPATGVAQPAHAAVSYRDTSGQWQVAAGTYPKLWTAMECRAMNFSTWSRNATRAGLPTLNICAGLLP